MLNQAFCYFIGTIVVTFVVTMLLCRYRIARKKRSFFVAALIGDVMANAVYFVGVFLSARFYADGWRIFTREAWKSSGSHSLESVIFDATLFIGLASIACLLPVAGVANYYKKKSKRNENVA